MRHSKDTDQSVVESSKSVINLQEVIDSLEDEVFIVDSGCHIKECPRAKVLILTQYDDKENLLAAGQAGTYGFIPKRAASAQLVDGIRVCV